MIAEERLRHSRVETTDTVWAIGSSEVFLLLRTRRGWDAEKYLRWLTRTLTEQLLVGAAESSRGRSRVAPDVPRAGSSG